jgi:hypothetical protein
MPMISMAVIIADGTKLDAATRRNTRSISRPKVHNPHATAAKSASRSICSTSRTSGSRPVVRPLVLAPGVGVGARGETLILAAISAPGPTGR